MSACAACRGPEYGTNLVEDYLANVGGLAKVLTLLPNNMETRTRSRLAEAEKGAEASLKAIVQAGMDWSKATIAAALDAATQQQDQSHFLFCRPEPHGA